MIGWDAAFEARLHWVNWLLELGWEKLYEAQAAIQAATLRELDREMVYDARTGATPGERPFGPEG